MTEADHSGSVPVRMLRLRVAAAVLLAAGACGGSPPVELRTAAAPPAVVQPDTPRPEPVLAPTTTTTSSPPPSTTTTAPAATTRTTAPDPPPVAMVASTGGDPAVDATWDRLASCESGGNWAANTGNGYYGGIQFALGTWHRGGGAGYPNQASRAEQIRVARVIWSIEGGWRSWPGCSRHFGWL